MDNSFNDWFDALPEEAFTDPRIKTRLQSIKDGTTVFSCKGTPLEKLLNSIIKNHPVPNEDVLELVIEGNYVLE
jgi:hypothetical protein